MKDYRCWARDLETEDEARSYKADTWKDAAEAFALWSFREEEFEELVVRVRCVESGELHEIDVESEIEVHMYLGLGHTVVEDDHGEDDDDDETEQEADSP